MKTRILKMLMLSATLFTLNNCKKSGTNNTQIDNCEMASYTWYGKSSIETHSITNFNKNIIEISFPDGKEKFIYDASNILIKKEFYKNGSTIANNYDSYVSDPNGNIIIRNQYSLTTNNNYQLIKTEQFNYDGKNIISIDGSKIFTYLNGNLIKYQSGSSIINFEYDLSKENKINSQFKYFLFQLPSVDFGKNGIAFYRSKNLLSKITDNNGIKLVTYSFNKSGYIKSLKINNEFQYFTYTCD